MALPAISIPPSVQPSVPDFHICSSIYGTVTAADCSNALTRMPAGTVPVLWTTDPSDPHHLDWTTTYGGCIIKIQTGDRNTQRWTLAAKPDTFRGMARWLIEECAVKLNRGGFATFNLARMLAWATDPGTVDVRAPLPPRAMFFTVSISNARARKPLSRPGTTEPAIGYILAGGLDLAAKSVAPGSGLQQHYLRANSLVGAQALQMTRGGDVAWDAYTMMPKEDMMTYVCDANLGAPAEVDCSQLEYAQLGGSGDTLQVGPGVVKFLFSKSCNVAITATVALTLTWAQIKTAITSLATVCVARPLLRARGGRAYYGAQEIRSIGGRSVRKRDELTGLNALPPHANVTIFQQIEPVPPNIHSCTWKQIVKGGNVASCP